MDDSAALNKDDFSADPRLFRVQGIELRPVAGNARLDELKVSGLAAGADGPTRGEVDGLGSTELGLDGATVTPDDSEEAPLVTLAEAKGVR